MDRDYNGRPAFDLSDKAQFSANSTSTIHVIDIAFILCDLINVIQLRCYMT